MELHLNHFEKMWEDRGIPYVFVERDIKKNKLLQELSSYGRETLLYFFNDCFVKCYTTKKDVQNEQHAGKNFFLDTKKATTILQTCRKDMEGVIAYYKRIYTTDYSKQSVQSLLTILTQLLTYNGLFLAYFELTQPQRTALLEKEHAITDLPLRETIIAQERSAWERIVCHARSKGIDSTDVKKLLAEHSDDYLFLGAFESHTLWTPEVLRKRLVQDLAQNASFQRNTKKGREKKDALLNLLADYAALRMDLSQYWTTPLVLTNLFLLPALSKTSGVPLHLLNALNEEELMHLEEFDVKKTKPKRFVVHSQKENIRFLSVEVSDDLYKQLVKKESVLKKGMVAHPGKAQGRARVISSDAALEEQMKKFKQGEILVTQMTSPNYIPILSKAAGIITDEGGITSHAAIVARERNIPCIVGTVNATKVLKTGTIIEIDAYANKISFLR